MKRPWMPLWVGDFITDTEHLTAAETGAYIRLIMFYWVSGGLPADEKAIARIARLDSKAWRRSCPALRALFKGPGSWTHVRIEAELAQVIEKSRALSANAQQKHSKSTAIAPILTLTHTKKEGNGLARKEVREGFPAVPQSEEFKAWKEWAFKQNIPLWRELQKRESENRSFDFETQWPL
jgi:uncharacterized protein YdaU (DUF1376 family)